MLGKLILERKGRVSPSLKAFTRALSLKGFDRNSITVKFKEGNLVHFSNIFLRDSCTAKESVDPYSKQKLFTTSKIVKNLSLAGAPHIVKDVNSDEECLEVVWAQNDGSTQTSIYTESFLKNHSNKNVVHQNSVLNRTEWDNEVILKNLKNLHVDYVNYLDSNCTHFDKVINNLNKFGIGFIDNIPNPVINPATQAINDENILEWPVSILASKFGYIKKTFYGTLFDVKNEKEEAKNIANTNTFLPLHMDLLYYESPPGLQLLHFINNSTMGGENVFSDSFAAVLHIKKTDPTAYEALKKVPITYHYNNNNDYYYYARPLIVEDAHDTNPMTNDHRLKEVNYSPPFQGPLQFSTISESDKDLMDDFIRGFEKFEDFVNDPKNQYEVKMREGSCVIFDNRRVLHSRLQFSDANGGDRWLMGCYIDSDAFSSKLRMSQKLNLNP